MLFKRSCALSEDGAEFTTRRRERAGNEQRPDERAVEAGWSRGNVVQCFDESRDQVDGAGLVAIEARHETAEVDTGGNAEEAGHVLCQDISADGACGRGVGVFEGLVGGFGEFELLAERRDVRADGHGVNAVGGSEGVETGDFGDEVHDAVIAAHELAETRGGAAEVLGAVGMSELGGCSLHGRAKDVDPCGEGHVEWGRGHVGASGAEHLGRQAEAVDQV